MEYLKGPVQSVVDSVNEVPPERLETLFHCQGECPEKLWSLTPLEICKSCLDRLLCNWL